MSHSFRAQVVALAAGVAIFIAGMLAIGIPLIEARALKEVEREINQVFALQQEAINGLFDKYRLLTGIVAREPDVAFLFTAREAGVGQIRTQQLLNKLSGLSGAANIQLADRQGKVFAQFQSEQFAPKTIAPDLQQAAMEGRLGRKTIRFSDDQIAYVFSSRVQRLGETLGTVTVYVDLQTLGTAWALINEPVFVTKPNGTLVVGNQLTNILQPAMIKTYPAELTHFVLHRGNASSTPYLARSVYLPLYDWHLNVLERYDPVANARNQFLLIVVLGGAVLGGMLFLLIQRWHIIRQRYEQERDTARELERRVMARTEELKREYDERIQAEAALRQAQLDLTQSAKLASIGQMSAALSHEYNQPIAAIRAYADNARAFLDRGRGEKADENLERITHMTDRMAKLSKTLKSFARKPGTQLRTVEVGPLMQEAIILVDPHAKAKRVELDFTLPLENITVNGGSLRLSQVLVNLLSNAIDAAAGTERNLVFLGVDYDEKEVILRVEDSGPGVNEEDRRSIFDPFVSQKDVSEGLGLGLSIAYNIVHDFGGEIDVGASKLGGAAFYVKLPRHQEKPNEVQQ
ncbi:sensor histidine kinase [Maritalea mediterranea]|uniref:histidine kinase n=1 Tax=Maritalea mediterranea TaxID=2909667 RepID=A0ABS9E2X1_9HYPH|nr:ATP-binding protein [Maritalea mediterranea]MCF4097221.1 ATP-binding protein [Maritalea mediterranea]